MKLRKALRVFGLDAVLDYVVERDVFEKGGLPEWYFANGTGIKKE
jgi:hypothetical protein